MMVRMLKLLRPLTVAACVMVAPAASPAADPKREDTDRAFLKSAAEGSISNPTKITEPMLEKICADLQPARGAHGSKDQRERQRIALRNVYETVVPPGAFRVKEYRARSKTLPIDVQRSLTAVDGALTLQVMDREGAGFEIEEAAAQPLATRVENKEIALRVVFRVEADDARNISPCFSYAKSAAWSMRVEPISYELIDAAAAGKSIAKSTTPAKEKLDRFVEPGAAALRITAQVEGSALEPEVVEKAVEAKRSDIEGCLRDVMASAGDTGTLAFGGTVTPSGVLENVTLEVEAMDGPEASECVAKAFAAVSVGKGAKTSRVHVTIAVEREGPAQAEVLTPPK